jgi:hypothetical protein
MFDHFWTMADFGADGADAAEIDALIAECDGPATSLAKLAKPHHH